MPHFDAKGEADAIFAAEEVPTTYLMVAFYWENFIYFGQGPRKSPDGNLVLALPLGGGKLPGIAVEDIGKWCTASSPRARHGRPAVRHRRRDALRA